MKQDILTKFPWPWLPTLALVIFFSFFMILIIRVSMKSRQSLLQTASTLPLDDGEKYE